MQDHKLKVFRAVAETGSFSKASKLVNLTQPAVSLQIQALEELYEAALFERTGKIITLTPAGKLLYKYAQDILNLYSTVEKEINNLTGLSKGNLQVGASSTIGNYLLPTVIIAFRKKYPKIDVNLLVSNTKGIVEMLNSGNIDIGLVEGDVSRQSLEIEKLLDDELVLIMSPDHPWVKRKNISISELVTQPVIMREDGSGTRQMIEKHLINNKISLSDLKISLVLGSTEAIKTAVEHGMGVSILSNWTVKKEAQFGTIKTNSFKDLQLTRSFTIIFHKRGSLSSTAKEFLEFLRIFPFQNII
ncbi:MAG: LysR family transcriptional regulator [Nitrospirae bacterium]|nr:LysR family transcriptional regulator [Nitrospirota bacterium]